MRVACANIQIPVHRFIGERDCLPSVSLYGETLLDAFNMLTYNTFLTTEPSIPSHFNPEIVAPQCI